MRNKPAYALQSVDNALRVAQLLQAVGPMRLTDVAREIDASVSSAHRMLSMLVYRGFAEQLPDRRYGPGWALRPVPVLDPTISVLRDRARSAMRGLVDAVGESANLVVLAGVTVRFVATIECDRVLRVGDRAGQALPAHLTSGGKAILARLPDAEQEAYRELGPEVFAKLRRDIAAARRTGYALNDQSTEAGLTAVGVAVSPLPGPLHAAICLAMPTVRFQATQLPARVDELRSAARAIELEFAEGAANVS
jgi:IclR family acetate operon transcriptional repressor